MIVANHAIRRLTTADAAAVQALFDLDPDYWLHVEGAPLRTNEGEMIFDDVPPTVPPERRHMFLVDDVALLDMLEGYPDEHTWFLGLIYLAPAARNRGLGTQLMNALVDYVRANNGSKLRLAVSRTHDNARRLYERLGFQFVVQRQRTVYTGAVVELDVLERAL